MPTLTLIGAAKLGLGWLLAERARAHALTCPQNISPLYRVAAGASFRQQVWPQQRARAFSGQPTGFAATSIGLRGSRPVSRLLKQEPATHHWQPSSAR